MRRYSLLCFLVGLLCALGSSLSLAQQSKTLTLRPETGVLAGQTVYTNSYAILIGVGKYANLPKEKHLQFATQDATDLRDVLVRSYGFPAENVIVLLDEQATRANIEAALAGLADDKVKAKDRVLVYFSGHGQTVKLQDGGEMGFLIPYDAKVDLAHPENRSGYLTTCLRMDSIWGYLEASSAKHRLLLADSCFGGLLIKPKPLISEKPNNRVLATLLARPALQAMTAGASNEEALEDPKLGHSTYTYKLLEELRAQAATADNVFLASELASALKVSVANLASLSGATLTPQFGNYKATEGDFVFVTTRSQKVPALTVPSNPVAPVAEHPVAVVPTPMPIKPVKTRLQGVAEGIELVSIPAGNFLMGDDDQNDNPRHRVYLDAYSISKNLITAKQYLAFCAATNHARPEAPDFNPNWSKTDHPIVNVSWDDAMDYCRWLSKETGLTVTLPTEAQWERAARGTSGLKFPWGNTFDGTKCANSVGSNNLHGTMPVGSYPSGGSPDGVLDMAGNVWQWCSDYYSSDYMKSSPQSNPTGAATGSARVLRGGSWYVNFVGFFRCACRDYYSPDFRLYYWGFRCVVSADSH